MGCCLQGHHQGGELDRIYLVKVSVPKDMPLSCDGLARASFIYFKGKLPSHPLSAFLAVELFPILGRLKHLYTYSISPPRFFFPHSAEDKQHTQSKLSALSQWPALCPQVSHHLGWREAGVRSPWVKRLFSSCGKIARQIFVNSYAS